MEEIEDAARKQFNEMPLDSRQFVGYFRDLERIAELKRQRAYHIEIHEAVMRKYDKQISMVRKSMIDSGLAGKE